MYAIRSYYDLDATLPAIDFSVSAFHGYDPYYGFDVKNISLVPEISIINQAAFYKKNSIGADFSIPVKSWIISGEAAYNQTTGYKDNIFTPNPDLNYILGVEKDIYGIKIIAEYTGSVITSYSIHYTKLYEIGNSRNFIIKFFGLTKQFSFVFQRIIFSCQIKA